SVTGGKMFKGLGDSDSVKCVIDGNAGAGAWWNCVGAVGRHGSPPGIPGPNGLTAYRSYLYIWKPGD
ncbi:uncharacterized protein METZ01_LOCUS502997, partial [marine metagenome]